MRKSVNYALAFILIGVLLVGCYRKGNVDNKTFSIVSTTAAPLLAPSEVQNTSVKTVTVGTNDFAFRLSAALLEQNGDSNFICSPFSVWLPLAALVNATDDADRNVLLEALGSAGMNAEDINKAVSCMLYDLTKQCDTFEGSYNPLQIVNAVFVDNNMTIKTDFAQVFTDYYRGTSINVDFKSQEAVNAVNQWASDSTNGLIHEVVESFDIDTVAAIANALYFSDRWQWEFNPEETKADTFHSPTGDEAAYFMLHEGDGQTYYEDEKIQATSLKFKTGGGTYIVLPKDGDATKLLSSMTQEYFSELQTNSETATGRLLLPRFTVDSGVMQMSDMLSALGISLFDKNSAPLTGGLVEEDVPIWLSGVMQKARIMVDEKGTTAAAVTVISAAGANVIESAESFEMICDRPFVFILYAHLNARVTQVLFTGIVNHIQ